MAYSEQRVNKSITKIKQVNEIIWSGIENINSDVVINKGEKLVIEAGTQVIFHGHYALVVYGNVEINGNDSNYVGFTVADTSGFYNDTLPDGGWQGIRFIADNAGPQSKISFCEIQYVKNNDSSFYGSGGAILADNYNNLEIDHCIFQHNKAANGAAIFCDNSDITLSNTILKNNVASKYGGALFSYESNIFVTNCLIYENSALKGGALAFFNCPFSQAVNNTISDNSAYYGGGIFLENNSNVQFNNNIIYYNTAYSGSQVYLVLNCFPQFLNSDIEGGLNDFGIWYIEEWKGTYQRNISSDPGFVDRVDFNYMLTATSSCIDAGLNSALKLPYDILDKVRVWDGDQDNSAVIDMGAYEYNAGPRVGALVETRPEIDIESMDGEIHVTITGGLPQYTITVEQDNQYVDSRNSNGTQTEIFQGLGEGTYTIAVTDGVGDVFTTSAGVGLLNQVKFSIRGSVSAMGEKFSDGVVIAYKLENNEFVPSYFSGLTNGKYLFENIDSALYIVYALPGPFFAHVLPTYYVNSLNWGNAAIVNAFGNVFNVDIDLLPSGGVAGFGEISGRVIYDEGVLENDLYKNNWFGNDKPSQQGLKNPARNISIYLKGVSGENYAAMSDNDGVFAFKYLPGGKYTIDAQYPGKVLIDRPEITISNNNLIVDSVLVVIMEDKIAASVPGMNPDDISVKLYPVPFNEYFNVVIDEYREIIYTIEIFDITGKKVAVRNYTKKTGLNTDVHYFARLSSGVYKCFIKFENIAREFVLVKQNN